MASRVQMMSKAFMNGEVQKDSFGANKEKNKDSSLGVGRKNVKKESSPGGLIGKTSGSTTPTMGRWGAKKEVTQDKGGETLAKSGSNTPNLGRWNVKKEAPEDRGHVSSHGAEKKLNSASTTPATGHWNVKKETPQPHEIKTSSISLPQEPRHINMKSEQSSSKSNDARKSNDIFSSKASIGNIGVKSRTADSLVNTCINTTDSKKPTNIKSVDEVKATGENKLDKVTADSETNVMDRKESLCESPNLGAKKDGKGTRFAKRKQKRAKRYRSDGYMLALEMATNSSEDEGFQNDPSLGDAINFLQWIRNPTLQNLAKLRRAVRTNDKDWMREFLEFDGLGLLFQCLKDLSAIQGFHLTDMVLKMECIMCIREVVNSQTGLDCLLQIKGRKDNIFGRRFASGMYI